MPLPENPTTPLFGEVELFVELHPVHPKVTDSEFIAVGMLFAVPVIETPMLADTLRFTPCGMELTEIVFVVGSDEG